MGDKNFRLPEHIRPTRYEFHIAPDLETKTFRAQGRVHIEFGQTFSGFSLHGVDLVVGRASMGGAPARVTSDATSETLSFAFEQTFAPGAHVLEVEWTGIFHDDLRGLYRAGDVAVTQFEAADARRVFPCFDEPPFKAVWALSIEAPSELAVLSNGALVREEPAKDGHTTRVFKDTPPMSSYLVAFVVGDLVGTEVEAAGPTPVRTYSVPAKAHLTAFAQECSVAVLPRLEAYFGREYVFGKLDNVGIPDFEAGAMENSGLVTYREVALLLDDAKAPLAVRKRVAEVITHELAHQWFGNLVTMQWWDDLWLNEAFATWMSYKIVDAWRPGWRMWDDFEKGKHMALHLDALASTHPIKSVVNNADEATENFDVITYEKGGAMLRMIEGWLGEEAFRTGIRAYMQAHAYGNTVADDLWNALGEASGLPVAKVTNGWLARGGYPLVTVGGDGARVELSQRRFSLDPNRFDSEPDEPWSVPIVLKWADDAGVHEKAHLFEERTATVELPAKGQVRWVCGNRGGAGFYRVRYEERALKALNAHRQALAPVERVNLISDAWALFRAGAGTLEAVLATLEGAAGDEDYTVTGEVVATLESLERRCVTEETRASFEKFAARLLRPRLVRLGWDADKAEDDDRRLARAALVRGLALVARDPEAVAEASARMARVWGGDEGALDPNLLDAASVAAARAGDEKAFDALIARAKTEADPATMRRILVALASVERDELHTRAIELVLDESVVPMQDVTTFFTALVANMALQNEAFDYTRSNWEPLRKRTAAPMLTRRFVEALGSLTHRRAEVERLFDEKATSLASVPAALRQTRERLALDEDVARRGRAALAAWLNAPSA